MPMTSRDFPLGNRQVPGSIPPGSVKLPATPAISQPTSLPGRSDQPVKKGK